MFLGFGAQGAEENVEEGVGEVGCTMVGVNVGGEVLVEEGMGVLVNVGGGKNGVLVGDGVILVVGVCVVVGVVVIVGVEVMVGVWLGVKEPAGCIGVKVMVDVRVANTTAVQEEVRAGVAVSCLILLGARSNATSPAQ